MPSDENPNSLFSCLCAFFSVATASDKKPNILLLFADDWGRYASLFAEVEGPGSINDVVRTPNFDRIAKEGVLFRNAHVSAPSCTPCRSALLTGQHFWRTNTGAILRGAVWDASLPSFPVLLRESGYDIGYSHKVWGPGTPANSPYTASESFSKSGGRFNQFSQNVTASVEAGMTIDVAKAVLLDESRANFRSFLGARGEGKPFSYWFGPTNTHRKWIKGSGKKLWGIEPDSLKGKMPPFLPDVPEVREDLADYFGESPPGMRGSECCSMNWKRPGSGRIPLSSSVVTTERRDSLMESAISMDSGPTSLSRSPGPA